LLGKFNKTDKLLGRHFIRGKGRDCEREGGEESEKGREGERKRGRKDRGRKRKRERSKEVKLLLLLGSNRETSV
jgi:hypothetical protein